MKALIRLLADLDPMFLFDPRKRGMSAIGHYALTYNGGLSATPVELPGISGGGKALSFDGTDDYISTDFGTRRNLELDQPQFNAIGSWVGSNATAAVSTDYAYVGTQSLKVTSTVNGAAFALNGNTAATNAAATAGQQYARSVRVRPGTTARQARVYLRWYDVSNVQISQTAGTPVTAPLGAWTELTVTATAPTGAVRSRVVLQWDSTVIGEVFYVDAVLTESGSTTGAYFDGSGHVDASGTWVPATDVLRTDLGDTAWTGTAHASTSTRAGRTNRAMDPRFESRSSTLWRTDTTFVAPTLATNWPTGGVAQSGKWTLAAAANGTAFAGSHCVAASGTRWTVSASTAYTLTVRCRNNTDQTLRYQVYRRKDAAGNTTGSTVSTNVPAGFDGRLVIYQATTEADAVSIDVIVQNNSGSAASGDFYWTESLLETGSSVNSYFDGSGSVEHRGLTGWLGLEHASASDCGVFANGTTRTFVGLARVSADAGSGVLQTLCGSNLTGPTTTALCLFNSGGTRVMRLAVNGSTYDWTLTAAEIAATAAGQTFVYRLEFDETADTAKLQINGLPAVTKTSVTAQHAAGQTAVQLGAYGSGLSPFPGLLGPGSFFYSPLSDRDWRAIHKTALAGAFG